MHESLCPIQPNANYMYSTWDQHDCLMRVLSFKVENSYIEDGRRLNLDTWDISIFEWTTTWIHRCMYTFNSSFVVSYFFSRWIKVCTAQLPGISIHGLHVCVWRHCQSMQNVNSLSKWDLYHVIVSLHILMTSVVSKHVRWTIPRSRSCAWSRSSSRSSPRSWDE